MEDFEYFLNKAAAFHGGTCVGLALGTRITVAALRYLGLDPYENNKKKIIVYAEIDRCMTDAVQAVTGCSLGKRSLKHADYGRFAATFVNLETGRAVRGTVGKVFSSQDKDNTIREIAATPDEDLVTLQPVRVDIPENDLPGTPRETAVCAACGERVADGRHVVRDGVTLCKACADGAYYTVVEKEG